MIQMNIHLMFLHWKWKLNCVWRQNEDENVEFMHFCIWQTSQSYHPHHHPHHHQHHYIQFILSLLFQKEIFSFALRKRLTAKWLFYLCIWCTVHSTHWHSRRTKLSETEINTDFLFLENIFIFEMLINHKQSRDWANFEPTIILYICAATIPEHNSHF